MSFTTPVLPILLEYQDSSNELYPELGPGTWLGDTAGRLCELKDTSSYRTIMTSITAALTFMDKQYRTKLAESSHAYGVSDCRICEIFRFEEFHQMLSYKVFTVCDTLNKGFYCFTEYCDFNMRPLFKDYELFLIDRLISDLGTLKSQYFRAPFLLALQRTCYLWLQAALQGFELKGSINMPIRWSHSKTHKNHYSLFTAYVRMEFDMTECIRNGNHITSLIDLKLSLPSDFLKSKIKKSRFENDLVFFSELWKIRTDEIENRITAKYGLRCDEDISDVH